MQKESFHGSISQALRAVEAPPQRRGQPEQHREVWILTNKQATDERVQSLRCPSLGLVLDAAGGTYL